MIEIFYLYVLGSAFFLALCLIFKKKLFYDWPDLVLVNLLWPIYLPIVIVLLLAGAVQGFIEGLKEL